MSQSKYCEIKYGEEVSEEELEKKYLKNKVSTDIEREPLFNCYLIGVEHDKNKKPILNKPIYACCEKSKHLKT